MAEPKLQPVASVDMKIVTGVPASYTKPPVRTGSAKTEVKETPSPVETVSRDGNISINKNTTLQFNVDSVNHSVTILVMDKESGKVIATIPQDAIRDLPPGKLLNYSG